jgi:hypothetical protein
LRQFLRRRKITKEDWCATLNTRTTMVYIVHARREVFGHPDH